MSQVHFGGHADRDGLQLRLHAQEFTGDAHKSDAHNVHHPPAEVGSQMAIVQPTKDHVEEVDCAGKVEAKLRPLDHVPEG